jgi:hypothetical protein
MKAVLAAYLLTAGLVLLVGTEPASAQYPGGQPYNPYQQPIFSPYLNLNRPGNPAINYFGLVKPQLDTNRQLQTLQTQQMAQMAQMAQMGIPTEGEALTGWSNTGHPTMFSGYSHYFGQNAKGQPSGATPFGKK